MMAGGISQDAGCGSTGPRRHEGHPLAHPAGWSPDTGEWHPRDGEVPIRVPVPAGKLCGLTKIISEIEEISGARFTVENVYYSEAEAEAAWWESTGNDPVTFFAMKDDGRD